MAERPKIILGIRRGKDRYETIFDSPDDAKFEATWTKLLTDPTWETIERYDHVANALRMMYHPDPKPAKKAVAALTETPKK